MQDNKAQVLLRFFVSLRERATHTKLFLGGDIFDLWLGGHQFFQKRFQPLIDELKNLISRGAQVYYFEGNHDLHLSPYWDQIVGAKVFAGPEIFLFDGTTVRVEHGDQMDPDDSGYIFLRWFLRTWPLRAIILHLPGWLVAAIGNWASRTSRNYTDGLRDEERILKVIHAHAQAAADEQEFDALITGHVHLRDEFHFQKNGRSIRSFNLGSWDDKYMVLKLTGGEWSWIGLT